jgi:uncharacterized protein
MVVAFIDLLLRVADRVIVTVAHTWPFLALSFLLAAAIQAYVGPERLGDLLRRSTPVAVLGAVVLGALTPFCSCGTMAVVLGSLAASVPWAPIVAFMASSPLTSPGEYALSLGLFGPRFATLFVVAAVGVGLLGGVAAWALERRGWLAGQSRVTPPSVPRESELAVPCCPAGLLETATVAVGPAGMQATATRRAPCEGSAAGSCGAARDDTGKDAIGSDAPESGPRVHTWRTDPRPGEFLTALVVNGRRLAWYFLAFASLGYLLIELVPDAVFEEHLGAGNALTAVPLAALLGIPMYVNTEGSLPLVAGLLEGGMGTGPALAFLITGAGTSIGAVSGMLLVARWRIVALVVGTLLVSACVTGWLAPLVL